MKVALHYARLNEPEIQELVFESYNHLKEWVSNKLNELNDFVVLFTWDINDNIKIDELTHYEIFVTLGYGFIEHNLINDEEMLDDISIKRFHIQEYESYEDAYKVALDMRETSPLCYNK